MEPVSYVYAFSLKMDENTTKAALLLTARIEGIARATAEGHREEDLDARVLEYKIDYDNYGLKANVVVEVIDSKEG